MVVNLESILGDIGQEVEERRVQHKGEVTISDVSSVVCKNGEFALRECHIDDSDILMVYGDQVLQRCCMEEGGPWSQLELHFERIAPYPFGLDLVS